MYNMFGKYKCNVRFRKMSISAICCLRKIYIYILFIIPLNTIISFQASTPLPITIFPRAQEEAKIPPKWHWLLFLDSGDSVDSIWFHPRNFRKVFLAITGVSAERVDGVDGRGGKRRGKKESQNFLTDDLHPSRENRTAKPLVCSFFRHVSSPCCQTTDSARPAPASLASPLEIFPSFS